MDTIIKLGKSKIQHGSYNDRIYLMHLAPDDHPGIIPRLQELAEEKHYTKIFVKIPDSAQVEFRKAGYRTEAFIPGNDNHQDTLFMLRCISPFPPRCIKFGIDLPPPKKNILRSVPTTTPYIEPGTPNGLKCFQELFS